MSDDPIAVAERLIGAIMAGNPEALREVYAPEARIWHNNDGKEQSVDENLTTLRWVVSNIRELRYEEIERERTESGFLQRHVLRGIAPSGEPLEVRACLVCKVENGRIVRLAEYLDTGHLNPLFARS
jgi:hypothetical protein